MSIFWKKHWISQRLFFLLFFVACLGSAVFAQDSSSQKKRRYSKTIKVTFPWNGEQTLKVTEAGGRLTVRGEDTETIEVKGIRTCFHQDLARAREHVQDVVMDVESRSHVLSLKTRLPSVWIPGMAGRIDYSAHVPATASLVLRTITGDITARDMTGAVRVDSIEGNIVAENISGDLDARTVTGNITANACEHVRGLETVTGEIYVDLDSFEGESLQINSLSGPIKIEFTEEPDATFYLSSVTGKINISTADSQDDSGGQDTSRIVMGEGSKQIFIRTITGNISIADVSEDDDEQKK